MRDGGTTPPTSDCFTPRTMDGNDAAFKGVKYGSTIEGPYRNGNVWVARILWASTIALAVAAVAVVALLS